MMLHVFRSNTSPYEEDFLNSAWTAHKRIVRVPDNALIKELLLWHYRHSVISAWGAPALRARLHPENFSYAEENLELADLYSLGFDDAILSSSPLPSSVIDFDF